MKKLVILLVSCSLLGFCTKQSVYTSNAPVPPAIEKDKNFDLSSFTATRSGDSLVVSFSTAWEKNIVSMDIMRGNNANQFCTIKTLAAKGNSTSLQQYRVVDNVKQGDTVYYIVRYTTASGEWGCSNPFKLFN